MVNRTMQAKTIKRNKQRRLFPKRFTAEYISVGAPPNRLVMNEYKERTKSLAFDAKYMEWLEKITRFRGKPPGKKEADEAAARINKYRVNPHSWLAELRDARPTWWARIGEVCPSYMHVALEDSAVRLSKMFFSTDGTHFILYEENFIGRIARLSITYQNRERCIARWRADQVRWVSTVSSSPPEPEVEVTPPGPGHWRLRRVKARSAPSA
jgi:hypothetical protein